MHLKGKVKNLHLITNGNHSVHFRTHKRIIKKREQKTNKRTSQLDHSTNELTI